MPTRSATAPGTFCWPELYTTDQNGAKAFYGGLFGWRVRDVPMGPDQVYTIFTLGDRDVAACYGSLPGMEQRGISPHWLAYVAVASADETTAKATAIGGSVRKEPFDVAGIGRMAALKDPTGAPFCLWESKGHVGVGVRDEPGALTWTELMTADPEKAAAFYEGLFGWVAQVWPMEDESSYHVFRRGEGAEGGMAKVRRRTDQVQRAWVSYFQVRDCDLSGAMASRLGGRISVPPHDISDVGRFAILTDPAGAHFGIMQPAPHG